MGVRREGPPLKRAFGAQTTEKVVQFWGVFLGSLLGRSRCSSFSRRGWRGLEGEEGVEGGRTLGGGRGVMPREFTYTHKTSRVIFRILKRVFSNPEIVRASDEARARGGWGPSSGARA